MKKIELTKNQKKAALFILAVIVFLTLVHFGASELSPFNE